LSGKLNIVRLEEILHLLQAGCKSGCLIVSNREEIRFIYFQQGAVVFVSSTNDNPRLLWLLQQAGDIPQDLLARAFTRCQRYRLHLGTHLVKRNLLARKDLEILLKEQSQENLYDLFLWPSGSFEFIPGKALPKYAIPSPLHIEKVMLDAMRRYDELRQQGDLLSRLEEWPRLTRTGAARLKDENLTELDRVLLSLSNGQRSLGEVVATAPPLGYYYILIRFITYLNNGWIELIKPLETSPQEEEFDELEESTKEEAVLLGAMVAGEADAEASWGMLEQLNGSEVIGEFLLNRVLTTIGRGSCADIVLEGDPNVSRLHARIRCLGRAYMIEDLNSVNGVKVNDQLIDQIPLDHGDIIQIGSFRFRFAQK
jgi:hypothetical protein